MKLVVAEKPSVAKYLADFLGANKKMDGYYQGNDYCVSWAVGHLLTIGHAKDYGYNKWSEIPVPFFPDFKLIPSKDKGLKVLVDINKKLMNKADLIINATDAEREGELIFRYLYEYSGSKVPVKRLWVNSLTKESIDKAFRSLKDSSEFDNLYLSAKARNHADWIVGINATTILTLKSGILYSLGRVQTPILKLIVDRTHANKTFESNVYHQLALTIDNKKYQALNSEKHENSDKIKEDLIRINLTLDNKCIVSKASFSKTTEHPLNLYSLSALQIDANKKFGYKAERTLQIAQILYQNKLISYPRTDSQHLSSDMFNMTSSLFNRFKSIKSDITYDENKLSLNNTKLFDNEKVSDHHAIIPTNESVNSLDIEQKNIYGLILIRFLASFAQDAIKHNANYVLTNKQHDYKLNCHSYSNLGWKLFYGNKESYSTNYIELKEDQSIDCFPTTLTKETKPKALYNDATLLLAMNSAGKDIEDERELEAMKGKGLGTPATQAGIIERLIKSEYITRKGKSILSTAKADELISMLVQQDSKIISVKLTALWEQKISMIQKGELSFDTFMLDIKEYTNDLLKELQNVTPKVKAKDKHESLGICPKCKTGKILKGKKAYFCSNFSDKSQPCNFSIFRRIANKNITDSIVKQLIKKKKTGKLKFKNKDNISFDAQIILKEDDFVASLIFSSVLK